MQMATEPMMMGSPVASPSSPGAHGQSPYLPAFLMGEPPAAATQSVCKSNLNTKIFTLILLITTTVVFYLFYLLIRSLLLRTKCVFKRQNLQRID